MKKVKGLFTLVLAMTLILCAIPMNASAAELKLVVDGKELVTDSPMIVENGVTLVPIKFISDAFGAACVWNATARTVTVTNTLHRIVLTIGSTTYTVDGATKTLQLAPRIQGGRTMVPLRVIGEAFGAKVDYIAATKTANISYFSNPALSGSIMISGSTTVQPIATAAADNLKKMNNHLSISVAGTGSGAGIGDAMNGTVNIGMSSRELKAEEAAQLNEYVIAHDGVAIIVHNSNAVRNLTVDQIKKIFTGDIKNWNEVGGANAPIIVYTRESTSGTLAALQDILGITVKDTATPTDSTGLMRSAVAAAANGIGYISSGQIDSSVKALTVGNIAPSLGNIKSGTYPICRNLLLVTKGKPGELAALFIDYLLSRDGQQVVVDEKYISVLD